ncbi:hypothetical protein GRI40_08730 [Altererythrobacter aerius]|uniref:Uncharacterized protein n=1 Tax=Tsuneonella aeria TaxID=1837929 RepID=A0A6I4TFB7_9SPHN|nr:hypothetical protein [Tsuneonella aeria]MXO75296.1 hypothetical protein [Tsuneonella aeria]
MFDRLIHSKPGAGRARGSVPAIRSAGAGWTALGLAFFAVIAILWGATASPAPGSASAISAPPPVASPQVAQSADLRLYRSIAERVRAGENYYVAASTEQRARSFPLKPGVAIRLPTLAWLQAALGATGTMAAAIVLLIGIAAAWWRRFAAEGASPAERRAGTALVLIGSALLLNPDYHVLHELWAGALIAFAVGIHRPNQWLGAVLVGALALAIRELALPFVMLMAAMALYRRNWHETAAWGIVVSGFALVLAWHLHIVSGYVLPDDTVGPGWLALRGPAGWVGSVILSSPLHVLPAAFGAFAIAASLLGWAAMRGVAGATVLMLSVGYGLGFMLAGRDDNFYWGLIVTQLLLGGMAFVPRLFRALVDLATAWRATRVSRALAE